MGIVHGYTLLPILKDRLKIADTQDDARLEDIITSVSRAIDDHCHRRFYTVVGEQRFYTPHCADELWVDDLLAVASLQTDEDGDRTYEITWQPTDYDLEPANAQLESQPQPYSRIAVTPLGRYRFPMGQRRSVRLVGTFGFAQTAPPVIQEACIDQCILEYRSKAAPFGTTGSPELGTDIRAIGLHPFVKRKLEPFRLLTSV